jgi:hypothetical protein
MPRPQVIVNVTTAIPRRGAATATGTAFFATTGGTGPTAPVRLFSQAAAETAFGAGPFATWVGDTLAEGTPEVVAVRAAAALADPTEAEWTTALNTFTATFGPGQVAIPGQATAAAHAALVAHQAASGRTALLDGDVTPTVAELTTPTTTHAGAAGARGAAVFAPWVPYTAANGTNRDVPASVLAAALAARGDAALGHTNHAPAGDQGRGAGLLRGANSLTTVFSNADHDTLNDAGVNLFVNTPSGPMLYGWQSMSTDPRFAQLNTGRLIMQLRTGLSDVVQRFLFRQIDGQGHLYAEVEGALRGYLTPLWQAGALFGAEADDAFDVEVAGVNTAADAAAGRLNAAVEIRASQHTERITIDVVTHLADGEIAA